MFSEWLLPDNCTKMQNALKGKVQPTGRPTPDSLRHFTLNANNPWWVDKIIGDTTTQSLIRARPRFESFSLGMLDFVIPDEQKRLITHDYGEFVEPTEFAQTVALVEHTLDVLIEVGTRAK